jgi:hypothetical protein
MPEKLKEWLLKYKDFVSGGALGEGIKQVSDYHYSHKDLIDHLDYKASELLHHFPTTIFHSTSGDPFKPFEGDTLEGLTPEQIFNDPNYSEVKLYLMELSQTRIEYKLVL